MNAAERKLQIECEAQLRKRGWRIYRLEIVGSRGFPDTFAIRRNKHDLYIEFKAGSPVSPQQQIIHAGLESEGKVVIIARSWADISKYA